MDTHAANEFKAMIRVNLMHEDQVTAEDATLTEKTFGLDMGGGLKSMTTRSKQLPIQSKAIYITRELLSLHKEVETSLDRLHMSEESIATSTSHETHCRTAIPTDGVSKKNIMKAVDNIFQVYCKCGFKMVKLHCTKKIEPTV